MRNLLIIIIYLLSCESKKVNNNEKILIDSVFTIRDLSKDSIYKMKEKIIKYGDILTYKNLSAYYSIKVLNEDFLFCALIMANKYHYPEAYYDVYSYLNSSWTDTELKNVDSTTQNMALYYLLKSYELGCDYGEDEIKVLFYGGAIPDSKIYLKSYPFTKIPLPKL